MNAGEWYRLTISWDFVNVGQNEQSMHVYLDGVDMPAAMFNAFGPAPAPAPDINGSLRIGARINPNQPAWVAEA